MYFELKGNVMESKIETKSSQTPVTPQRFSASDSEIAGMSKVAVSGSMVERLRAIAAGFIPSGARRVASQKSLHYDTKDNVLDSAKLTSENIRSLNASTAGDIESALELGNSALKEHLDTRPLTRDVRDSAKKIWRDTILDQFKINPEDLKCKDQEITKLIPEMAKLIISKKAGVDIDALHRDAAQIPYSAKPSDLIQIIGATTATAIEKERAVVALSHLSYHDVHIDDNDYTELGRVIDDEHATVRAKSYAAAALKDFSGKPGSFPVELHRIWGSILANPNATSDSKGYAAEALFNLSTKQPAPLFEADIYKQLIELLKGVATPRTKEYAVGVLRHGLKNQENHPVLVEAKVHLQLVALLKDSLTTPMAKQYAAEALCYLSATPANHEVLVKDNVHLQLVALLKDSLTTPMAKQYAAEALFNLSLNFAKPLVDDGVHRVMGNLVNQPVKDYLKKIAVGALCNLSADKANRETIVKSDIHNLLDKLLNNDQANADAKKNAAGALLNLSSHFDLRLTSKQAITLLIPGLAGDHSTEQGITTDLKGTMFKGQRDEGGNPSNGILITKEGHIYQGGFKDEKLEGEGKHTFPDGTSFEGVFKDGELEGEGTLTRPDGTSTTGKFRQGKLVGFATHTFPDGRKTEYQATYTGDDKEKLTKEELNRRMAAPKFVELLTGVGDDGTLDGYVLPLISTHLKYLDPTTPQMEKLASQLDFAAEIQNEEAAISIGKIKVTLATADNEVVIPYGMKVHAMLLKLKFTESGLNVEIYNSGYGLLAHHAHHHQSEVNKYNTCKEKLYPNMRPNSPEFNSLLANILQYSTFETIDQSYAVFAGAQDVVGGTPNWQRDQKASNCTLECVMAFLKKNMSPADYLQYRMTLIGDVKEQAEAHKDSYEETLDPKVAKRLDEMLANRRLKQSQYQS